MYVVPAWLHDELPALYNTAKLQFCAVMPDLTQFAQAIL